MEHSPPMGFSLGMRESPDFWIAGANPNACKLSTQGWAAGRVLWEPQEKMPECPWGQCPPDMGSWLPTWAIKVTHENLWDGFPCHFHLDPKPARWRFMQTFSFLFFSFFFFLATPHSMWDLSPWPGNLRPLQWKRGGLTTGLPGKSLCKP